MLFITMIVLASPSHIKQYPTLDSLGNNANAFLDFSKSSPNEAFLFTLVHQSQNCCSLHGGLPCCDVLGFFWHNASILGSQGSTYPLWFPIYCSPEPTEGPLERGHIYCGEPKLNTCWRNGHKTWSGGWMEGQHKFFYSCKERGENGELNPKEKRRSW